MTDLVSVAAFVTLHEALIARSRLEAEGVRALVPDEHTHALMTTSAVRVFVERRDLPRARGILRAVE
jgi:hypothetical protein